MPPRFLTPADVAETLNVSVSQVMALLRSGELRGVKFGGKGEWRVEGTELEAYIAAAYAVTDASVGREDAPPPISPPPIRSARPTHNPRPQAEPEAPAPSTDVDEEPTVGGAA